VCHKFSELKAGERPRPTVQFILKNIEGGTGVIQNRDECRFSHSEEHGLRRVQVAKIEIVGVVFHFCWQDEHGPMHSGLQFALRVKRASNAVQVVELFPGVPVCNLFRAETLV
jgi:hypothetical protein